MELLDVINSRRSVRNYIDKEVDKSILSKIIESGIVAPSAKNLQPWYYVVVTNKELKNKIAELLNAKNIEQKKSLTNTVKVIETVPALILVFNRYENDDNNWFSLSIGASIENMLLTAKNYGLSSLWIGYITKIENEIKELLNKDMHLLSAIAIGYSDDEPIMPTRLPQKKVTEWRE